MLLSTYFEGRTYVRKAAVSTANSGVLYWYCCLPGAHLYIATVGFSNLIFNSTSMIMNFCTWNLICFFWKEKQIRTH